MSTATTPQKEKRSRGKKAAKAPATAAASFVPSPPIVDLLPKSLQDAVALRKVWGQVVAAGIFAVIALALVLAAHQGVAFKAERDLQREQATAQQLSAQVTKYRPVETYFGQIQSNSEQIVTNMTKEVATQRTLKTVYDVSKATVDLKSVEVTVDTSVAGSQNALGAAPSENEVFAGCPQIDPFSPSNPAVGCVKVRGVAKDRDELSDWVTAVGKDSTFVSPFISTSTVNDEDKNISFEASIGVTTKVFSLRYTRNYLTKVAK